MILHIEITDSTVWAQLKNKEICAGGNKKLKIYGRLDCKQGKRMKRQNRVFFVSEKEAIENGYRPCGHCMKHDYKKWKDGLI